MHVKSPYYPLIMGLLFLPLISACTSLNRDNNGSSAGSPGARGDMLQYAAPTDAAILTLAEQVAIAENDPTSDDDVGDELGETIDETSPEFPDEYVGGEFCRDDIYSSYLMQQYLQSKPKVKSGGKSRKGRKGSSKNTQEVEALHYASQRLNGPTPPYFGGLPVVTNPTVEQWISYFKTKGRKHFIKWLVRSQSIQNLVLPILQREGMPQELFFLAMIESGFSNNAYSSAKATGTWQFMSGTAKLYGLKINHWVDERKDPVKSTEAAARYLRDLYEIFGDWYLAIASYNAGPGKIKKAIRKSGSNDFWKLAQTPYIRPETKHYVPKLLAAMIIATNPAEHGFNVVPNPDDVTPTTTVAVDRPVELGEVARHLGLSFEEVQRWNPELLKGVTPPPSALGRGQQTYSLRLPESYLNKFADIAEDLPMMEIQDVMLHRVRRGDTLGGIARRYSVNVKQILSMNPELTAKRLKIGREIAIPIPAIVRKAASKSGGQPSVASSGEKTGH